MKTDQAFDLLKDAGATESISIQTVRRWLREGKIKSREETRIERLDTYDDIYQAFDLLKDAGIIESISIQTVSRWRVKVRLNTRETGREKLDT